MAKKKRGRAPLEALASDDESVLTVEALDTAIEKMKPFSPSNPYMLPPRLTWCEYPQYQQSWFEQDLRLGIGVLKKEEGCRD